MRWKSALLRLLAGCALRIRLGRVRVVLRKVDAQLLLHLFQYAGRLEAEVLQQFLVNFHLRNDDLVLHFLDVIVVSESIDVSDDLIHFTHELVVVEAVPAELFGYQPALLAKVDLRYLILQLLHIGLNGLGLSGEVLNLLHFRLDLDLRLLALFLELLDLLLQRGYVVRVQVDVEVLHVVERLHIFWQNICQVLLRVADLAI